MNTFTILINTYGRGKWIWLTDYGHICAFYSMNRVTGSSKDGLWIYIPKNAVGLHEIREGGNNPYEPHREAQEELGAPE